MLGSFISLYSSLDWSIGRQSWSYCKLPYNKISRPEPASHFWNPACNVCNPGCISTFRNSSPFQLACLCKPNVCTNRIFPNGILWRRKSGTIYDYYKYYSNSGSHILWLNTVHKERTQFCGCYLIEGINGNIS